MNDVFNVRSQIQPLQMQSDAQGHSFEKHQATRSLPQVWTDAEFSGYPTTNLCIIRSGRQMSIPWFIWIWEYRISNTN